MIVNRMKAAFLAVLIVGGVGGVGATSAEAATLQGQQKTVNKALVTIRNFHNDPNLTWFRNNVGRARALVIVPTSVKAGFILGGSGGGGLMLARSPRTGVWSYPAFYRLGSITFGLQIGGEVSEIVLLVMTQRGVDALMASSFKLGGDVSVAVGPVGAGAKAQTADILAFSRTKGLYGGINLEGAVIDTHDAGNNVYYGRRVSPADIVIRRRVRNRGADRLRATVCADRPPPSLDGGVLAVDRDLLRGRSRVGYCRHPILISEQETGRSVRIAPFVSGRWSASSGKPSEP